MFKVFLLLTTLSCGEESITIIDDDYVGPLAWPIDCIPGVDCNIGHADINGDGQNYDCGAPGYTGHQGTDISISWNQRDDGVDVFSAANGTVKWIFDGKYDRCPDPSEPDCQESSYVVCTESGSYCDAGDCCCFWCFAGGNVIVILHSNSPGVFATRYDHLKKNSIVVKPGDQVTKGQKIAEVGSAGALVAKIL